MAKVLDIKWLQDVARDRETIDWLKKIFKWREYVLDKNEFINNSTSFSLQLGNYSLHFNAASSFSAIEVYQEIFKEKSHFIAPGFSGQDDEVILDIGANQGFYTLKLKEINPECKIIALEPNPNEYRILQENIRGNNIGNVFLEEKAITPFCGTMSLEIIPQIGAIGGTTVKIPERPWIKDSFIKKVEVQTITLDMLLEKYNIDKVDILKIDVEGLEYEILRNCTMLNRIKKIVLEYHNTEIRSRLIPFMKGCMFDLVYEGHEKNAYYGDLYFINRQINNLVTVS